MRAEKHIVSRMRLRGNSQRRRKRTAGRVNRMAIARKASTL